MNFSFLRLMATLCLTTISIISFSQTKLIGKTKPKLTLSITHVPVNVESKNFSASKFKSALDSVSYAVGVLVANNFKSQNVTLDVDMVAKGFAAASQGGKLQLTEAECQSIMNGFMLKNQERQSAETAKQFLPNKELGEKFLAVNKKKDSVMVTASGLQYKIMKLGTGPKPLATNTVKTHYHGTLIDGTVFDSSVQRGEPVSFPVSGVIPGWIEALQLMPVGSKFKLYIPQELAYGIRGGGQAIKPYSALIFEVELLEIEK